MSFLKYVVGTVIAILITEKSIFFSAQVYLMEVLDVERRAIFGSTMAVCVSVGAFLVFAFDAALHGIADSWVIVAWIFIGIVIIQCFGLMFIPKSPQWLITKGRWDCAEASLKVYRGPNTDITKVIHSLL